MPSLNWIGPYLQRLDLSKTDIKIPFQLKDMLFQRNGIPHPHSLSAQKSKIKRTEKFCSITTTQHSTFKKSLRPALSKTAGPSSWGRLSSGWWPASCRIPFPMRTAWTGLRREAQSGARATWSTRSSLISNQSLFHRLHFSIPKLIPSKTWQIVAASECLAHSTPVLYRLGIWSSNLSACIKSWRSNTLTVMPF